jgi:hypothetical protein
MCHHAATGYPCFRVLTPILLTHGSQVRESPNTSSEQRTSPLMPVFPPHCLHAYTHGYHAPIHIPTPHSSFTNLSFHAHIHCTPPCAQAQVEARKHARKPPRTYTQYTHGTLNSRAPTPAPAPVSPIIQWLSTTTRKLASGSSHWEFYSCCLAWSCFLIGASLPSAMHFSSQVHVCVCVHPRTPSTPV